MTLHELLSATDGDYFEFKEAKNRYDFEEAMKYCCALVNCGAREAVRVRTECVAALMEIIGRR